MGAPRVVRKVRNLTLDAGALIAYERRDRSVRHTIHAALAAGVEVRVPAGALAQVWRDGRRQVELRVLLRNNLVKVADLTEPAAKAAGELCGRAGTRDVIDASVVVCARDQRGAAVLTTDPADLRRLAPGLELEAV